MDSTRWDSYEHRPGDIVICTPPKCGTTWVQTIVGSLLFPDGDLPGPVMVLSPWLDSNFRPIDEVLATLEGQEHRRWIKSHLPAEALPFYETASYVCVFRDGRDAFMSWLNHMASFRPEVTDRLNAQAADRGWPQVDRTDRDLHEQFAEWLALPIPVMMLAGWWARRHLPNVLLVHYNDLKADLDGEMRRIAGFLDVAIDSGTWPAQVERCTFASMQARAEEIGPFEEHFVGGGNSFLHRGVNGRWHEVLTDEEVAAYQEVVAQILDPEAGAWLERGSRATGIDPGP